MTNPYLGFVSMFRSRGNSPCATVRLIAILLFLNLLAGCSCKSLPEGLSYAGGLHATKDITFLKDLTYVDTEGTRQVEQEIFDEAFALIAGAEKLVLIDMFLYNDFQGPSPEETRLLSGELTDLLIEQKKKKPAMDIIVISDPVNDVYGGMPSKQFARLREAGISVTITDLDRLRDSNTFYSPFWRIFLKPFGNREGGLLPNPFGGQRVSLLTYMKLLNFKANHRKVLIADSGETYVGFITSANPHDGSSAHGNVAVKFSGPAVSDLLATELAVLAFSGTEPAPQINLETVEQVSDVTLQVVTEKKIKDAILDSIEGHGDKDRIDITMFYLADRDVIHALKKAEKRGVVLRVLLDPNKDAFGRKKNGIPNRQVARELHRSGIPVKWCDTHGEQCHAKMLLASKQKGDSTIILGSANFTRRNLEDFNLETDVIIRGRPEAKVFQDAANYFAMVWNNNPRHYSVDYPAYEDNSIVRRMLYRIMEGTGMSSF
ncbi:MAG: phospholipase D-like domain-containing protein [Desulfobulbales bacterium]|nr:phospholipase D-like domain-containing protein [Desulfobulbales bacterium]